MKNTLFLLALALSITVFACNRPSDAKKSAAGGGAETKPAGQSGEDAAEKPDKVTAYYFHGSRRCKTCLGIQNGIERTVNERFSAEAAAGKLVYRDVNTELEANKHFVKQFDLSFSTLIVAAVKGDKPLQWENCEKIWEYGHEPQALMQYAEGKIKEQLSKLETK